jgi:PIN domain nuclease of toxin-antitoxin system
VSKILLDTCAVIYLALGQPMAAPARDEAERRPLHISAISALEISMLVRRNRLMISAPTKLWFATLVHRLDAQVVELPAELLIASVELSGDAPKDPFDRIVIATARLGGFTLMTRDRLILEYCRVSDLAWAEC